MGNGGVRNTHWRFTSSCSTASLGILRAVVEKLRGGSGCVDVRVYGGFSVKDVGEV